MSTESMRAMDLAPSATNRRQPTRERRAWDPKLGRGRFAKQIVQSLTGHLGARWLSGKPQQLSLSDRDFGSDHGLCHGVPKDVMPVGFVDVEIDFAKGCNCFA